MIKKFSFLLAFLLCPTLAFAIVTGFSIANTGTTYTYYGHPGTVQGAWSGYGVAYVDRVYIHSETAGAAGTVDAVNLYIFNVPGGAYKYACVYNGTSLVGKADISSISSTGWTGFITVTEESTDSLDYSSGDYLNAGFCIDGTGTTSNAVGDYLGEDSGNSGNIYYETDSWATNPPATVTWESSSHSGLGVRIRCEE